MADCLIGAYDLYQRIATDEGKIEVIKKWPIPTNVTEIQSSLGFVGHYRQVIPNFM